MTTFDLIFHGIARAYLINYFAIERDIFCWLLAYFGQMQDNNIFVILLWSIFDPFIHICVWKERAVGLAFIALSKVFIVKTPAAVVRIPKYPHNKIGISVNGIEWDGWSNNNLWLNMLPRKAIAIDSLS